VGFEAVSLRAVAALALVVAVLVWVAAVRPAARDLESAQQQYARLRDERQRLRQRTAVVERQVAAQARLASAYGPDAGDPAKTLRRFVVESVSSVPLSDVRLETVPGRGATAARIRLSAVGSFRDVLRLGELLGPESGLALERVDLAVAGAGRVRAEIEGFTLGAPAP
jgi:type II secretory pathway component PulM